VIDDYAPQADPRAQRDLDRRVQRVLRNVGNRAGRGRLMSYLTQRPDRPPRGFLLCNGEELPPGLSINARLVPVEVERRHLDLAVITSLQENGHRLRHCMRGFIEWLAPQMRGLGARLPADRADRRRVLQRGSGHLRQPEAMANLLVAMDTFLRFAQQAGAIDAPAVADLVARTESALRSIAARQSQALADHHPAELFIEVLSTLVTQGKVKLLDVFETSAPVDSEMIGWLRDDMALLLPDAAYRRVAMFLRETGEHWAPSLRELHKELVARGYLAATADGRDSGQWRVGPERKKKRGWLLRLAAIGISGRSASRDASTSPHEPEAPDPQEDPDFPKFSNGHALVPPLPPLSAGAGALPCTTDEE
jgi:hypothetical protein